MTVPLKGAGGSTGGVEVLHLDTFTRDGDTPLTSHTPEIGNGYVQAAGGSGTYTVTAANDVLDIPDTISHRYAWTILDAVPRQIKIDWRHPDAFNPMGILFRLSDATHYWKVKTYPMTNDMWLIYADGGGEVTADSDLNISHTDLTWYTYWVDLNGNDIDVYFALKGDPKPGSPILSASSAIMASNKGIGFYVDHSFQRFDNVNAWSVLME